MKTQVVIHGAGGRMGRRVIALCLENDSIEIAGAVDRQDHPDIGKDAGQLAAVKKCGVPLSGVFPDKADAVIDFSLPDAADTVIDYCTASKAALVMCTTGLSDQQKEKLNKASQSVAVLEATNMSVGMNVLFSIVGHVAELLGDQYDIEIVEQHHRFKKDSPSGTALTLAERIAEKTASDFPNCLTHGRQGREALREKGKIGMHAVRAGDITGKHAVIYSTIGETVTISHEAHNRDNFAAGAVRAAAWLAGKKPGKYSMADVLGIS